jgi:putative transposase
LAVRWRAEPTDKPSWFQRSGKDAFLHCFESEHDFMLVHPLCCNDDRAGEIGPTFHSMTRHDLVLANDTHSRPHVSDDNPYSESQFRTMKYRPEFPDRFGCIQDSRAFAQEFFRWYNEEHYHSGLALLTPAMVHYQQTGPILQQRQQVLDVAYQLHPERFVRQAPKPPAVPTEVWINRSTNRST